MITDSIVTIVITSYNRSKYLISAIESVLNQTYPVNLLIWVDGSTDNTSGILLSKYVDSFLLVNSVHLGRGLALKKAIDFSLTKFTNTEYIGWVDDDDILHPAAVLECLNIFKKHSSIDLVYTQYKNFDNSGKILGLGNRCRYDYSLKQLKKLFIVFHFRLIRLSKYLEVGGVNPFYETIEDYELVLRIANDINIYQLKKPLYYYRNHEDCVSFKYVETQENLSKWLQYKNLKKIDITR